MLLSQLVPLALAFVLLVILAFSLTVTNLHPLPLGLYVFQVSRFSPHSVTYESAVGQSNFFGFFR